MMHRSPTVPDDINGLGLDTVTSNIQLLIPVRIELHPALLHADIAEMVFLFECTSCKVAFHNFFSLFEILYEHIT